MPYLGNEPGAITDATVDTFTGNGSTTNFTLSQSSDTNSVIVRVHGVVQRNGADFTVSGTTLSFSTAPPAASNNIVAQFFTVGSVQSIADSAVSTQKIADDAVTLAKMAGGTDGNLITFDASGNPAYVATGNAGQLLTSAGAGAPPTFTTVTAGGLQFISTTDISSAANYSFTSFDSSSFDAYLFVLINVTPASDAVNLDMFTSTDGGSSYDSGSSDYNWTFNRGTVYGSDSGDDGDSDADDDSISLTGNNSGGANVIGSDANEHGVSGQIWMYNPASTKITHGTYDLMYQANTPENLVNIAKGGYARMSAADVDAIRIMFSSGDIESGTINAYGVVNA